MKLLMLCRAFYKAVKVSHGVLGLKLFSSIEINFSSLEANLKQLQTFQS